MPIAVRALLARLLFIVHREDFPVLPSSGKAPLIRLSSPPPRVSRAISAGARRQPLPCRERLHLVFIAAAGLVGACSGDLPGFVCASNDVCVSQICSDGSCAHGDTGCAFGLRWDDSAGARANLCVVYPDLLLGDPNCDNGKLDPGETCDDGAGSPKPCPTLASCSDGERCTNDVLLGTGCHRECGHTYDNLPDGVKCPVPDGGVAKAGTCENHVCCTGCVANGYCESGSAPTQCGGAGAKCKDCNAGLSECKVGACGNAGCTTTNVANGTPCATATGVCNAGACCTGCLQPAVMGGTTNCVLGSANHACGSGGAACTDCGNLQCGLKGGVGKFVCLGCTPQCGGKVCGPDGCGGSCGAPCAMGQSCQNGQCVCVPSAMAEDNDTLCANKIDDDCNGKIDCADEGCNTGNHRCDVSGVFCVNHACTAGCLVAGVYYPPGPVAASPCLKCDPKNDTILVANDLVACTRAGVSGACHAGACCTGCWDDAGGLCRVGTGTSACGVAGKSCTSCLTGCANGLRCPLCGNLPCATGNLCANGVCGLVPTAVCCGAGQKCAAGSCM